VTQLDIFTTQNTTLLDFQIAADTPTVQFVHKGHLPKEWKWYIFHSTRSFYSWLWIWKKI